MGMAGHGQLEDLGIGTLCLALTLGIFARSYLSKASPSCVSACTSVRLSVHLSVCLSVCLCLRLWMGVLQRRSAPNMPRRRPDLC